MGQSGAAAVVVGLWVLVTVGVAADPNVTEPQRCLLSHYRSLDPRVLLAVKALRDHYVSDAQRPWSPHGPSGPGPSRLRDTSLWPEGRSCSSVQQAHL